MTAAPRRSPTRATDAIRRSAAILVAALLLAQVAGPASAHHGGRPIGSFANCQRPVSPPRCTSVANDSVHYVAFDSTLTVELAESLRDTMAQDYEPTKLVMIEQAEVTADMDVVAFSEDYGNIGAAGWVFCPADAPHGINRRGHRWCQRQELRFNLNASLGVYFADDPSRDYVTCHELGHTIGLRHWGNPPESAGPPAATCMNADTPDGPTDLHQFDRDHIDAYRYTMHPRLPRQLPTDVPARRERISFSPWADASVEATELEHFSSLAEMTQGSDAVVLGRVADVTPGRSFGGASGRPLHYAAVTIQVDEVVAGALPGRHAARLTLEVPLFGGPDTIEAVAASITRGESLFFLCNKGTAEADFYRLVILRGVIVNRGGVAAVPPGDDEVITPLDGVAFEEVVRRVRAAAR